MRRLLARTLSHIRFHSESDHNPIAGTVKDPNDAIIAGTEVTVTCLATAKARKVLTGAEGNYAVALSALAPGAYSVRQQPADSTRDPKTCQIINPSDLGDFGRITSTSNNPRLIQLALKLNF